MMGMEYILYISEAKNNDILFNVIHLYELSLHVIGQTPRCLMISRKGYEQAILISSNHSRSCTNYR